MLLLTLAACGGTTEPVASGAGLTITTLTTGLDPDTDGYVARVEGRVVTLPGSGDTTVANLSTGTSIVELSGAEPNCTWRDGDRRQVELAEGVTTRLLVAVDCVESVAAVRLAAVTWGTGQDPDGYLVALPDGSVRLPGNGESVVTLHTGTVQFTVSDLAAGCRLQESTPFEEQIEFGVENDVQIDFLCGEPEQIAFTKSVSTQGAPSVFLVTADGSDTVEQTLMDFTGGSEDSYPSWSPDGAEIIYQIKEYPGFALFKKSVTTGATTKLSTDQFTTQLQPAWSRDGSTVAYTSSPLTATGDATNLDIYVMAPDGNNIRRLTVDAARDQRPAWSPDGARIAFVSDRTGNNDIYVMNADGTGIVNLTNDPADDDAPRWSPDGSTIVFASNRQGNYDIFVVNQDGGGIVQITDDPADDLDPAWAPGGRKLAFVSGRADTGCRAGSPCQLQLFVMNVGGNGLTRITTDLKPVGTPAWRP